jgi:hypothetical protein
MAAAEEIQMSDSLTMEERAKLSSAVADVRRLVDALRAEMSAMREELHLPPMKTKSRRATAGGVD